MSEPGRSLQFCEICQGSSVKDVNVESTLLDISVGQRTSQVVTCETLMNIVGCQSKV